ncbi:ceramidase domain-containing protein [Methylobacterium sp. ID0610]|uniref:ceramidase domain-containing protein n=1 Tax=Methylobacterium carpenticola TaxID=3344827 RepID=UPI0036AE2CDB
MGWWEPVRAYCERTDAGVWAEPLNALSNAAFLIAAILLIRAERRRPSPDPVALALAGLVGVIGIGSFLFHTLAVAWAELADVLPIALFIHAYFFLALRRLLGLGLGASLVLTLAFLAAGFGCEPALSALAGRPLGPETNGSVAYLPALLALLGMGGVLGAMPDPERRRAGGALLGIAGLFLLSLAARTLDAAFCPVLPFGTHWLWHILNAVVLASLVRVAGMRNRPGPGSLHGAGNRCRRSASA